MLLAQGFHLMFGRMTRRLEGNLDVQSLGEVSPSNINWHNNPSRAIDKHLIRCQVTDLH